MKIDYVLDTSAMCAYHLGEPGSELLEHYLSKVLVMHAVNVAEFCFSYPKRQPQRLQAKNAWELLALDGIGCAAIFTPSFLMLTAEIRLVVPALSVGDGFAVGLASVTRAPVLTADRAFQRAADFADIELIRPV